MRLESNFGRSLILAVCCCVLLLSTGGVDARRKKKRNNFYEIWKPLDLVRGLRSLSMDPYDVFRSLDAVKWLDSETALDFMRDINMRPITIYDALEDLAYDPFDAYYALKAWLADPDLRPADDPINRVNVTGDPKHPYLHVSYKSTQKDGKPVEDIKAQYLNSEEVEKELDSLEKEYKTSINDDKYKMSNFIRKAKRLHSAFDDPKKIFQDFFGKRHFKEWKRLFPEAFNSLKGIYRNPLGDGLKQRERKSFNANKTEAAAAANKTDSHDSAYNHAMKGRTYKDPKKERGLRKPWWWQSSKNLKERGHDAFDDPNFNDPNRYEKLKDETNVEEENTPQGKGNKGVKKVHHVKRYFDKLTNMYVECKKTEECEETPNGLVRRVKSHVRHIGPTPGPSADQANQTAAA